MTQKEITNTAIQHNLLNMEKLIHTVQRLSLARDIGQVMEIVRKVARELTGADGATFVLRDGNLCYYADEDAISPLWKGGRFPMENCISGWVMFNKQPVVIEDIYSDSRIPADAYRPTFVKSLAMVPIRTIDPIGAIGNYWAYHRLPTHEEVTMLQALADITAVSIENIEMRNKLEEKLSEREKMLAHLENQKKQLEEFTYIIAHNLRAPLSNLVLMADMAAHTSDTEKKMEFTARQKPIIDSLHEVFEELVNAIHVKTDFSIASDHIELEDCVARTLNLLQNEITETNADITCDFSEARTAYFPKTYIDGLLFNLLSNAIRFHSPGHTPQIHIRAYKNEGWTWIEVKDNGLGIDLDKHGDKLFKLRQTFHSHPKAKGFGLFITKTQVEAMGGNISVASAPGQGSTFTVKLHKNK